MGKTEYLLITIVFNLFFLLFMVAIITYVWQYKKKKKESELLLDFQKSLHQKELLNTQLEIQKQTMQEIGREIHDNVGQKLTLASFYIHELLSKKTTENDNNINTIYEIINNSLADLRLLSKTLTNDSIAKENIAVLLQLECEKVHNVKKCIFEHDEVIDKLEFSYHLKSMLIRIAQEFIQNSLKHAQCDKIQLKLSYKDNNVILIIVDDGKGFDVANTESLGIGLKNIKKRTESVGGDFILESNKQGTKLTLKLPLTL
jgi:signal transduction histidine kinase